MDPATELFNLLLETESTREDEATACEERATRGTARSWYEIANIFLKAEVEIFWSR